jgi:hypothetical protein
MAAIGRTGKRADYRRKVDTRNSADQEMGANQHQIQAGDRGTGLGCGQFAEGTLAPDVVRRIMRQSTSMQSTAGRLTLCGKFV